MAIDGETLNRAGLGGSQKEETVYSKESRSLFETSAVNSQTFSAKDTGSEAIPQIELVTIGPRERIYEETLRILQKEEGR